MQTIEDGPRGEELEPYNNPQAPVLQKSEYLAIGKSPSVNAAYNTGGSSPSRGQQEEVGYPTEILLIIKTLYGSCTGSIRPGIQWING